MQRVELGDARLLERELVGELGDASLQGCDLGVDLTQLGLRPRQRVGGGREPAVVVVEPGRHLRFVSLGGGHLGAALLDVVAARGEGPLGVGEARGRLVEGGGGGPTGRRRADVPALAGEAVAIMGGDDGRRMGDRHGDGGVDALDTHRPGKQRVEEPGDVGTVGRHVRTDRLGVRRRERGRLHRCGRCAECQHGAGRVGLRQRTQGARGVLRVVHDDARQRLTQCRFDRRLPAGIDAHEIEQRAEHAVEAGEAVGPGAGVGEVERELQRLDAGRGGRAHPRPAPPAARQPSPAPGGRPPCAARRAGCRRRAAPPAARWRRSRGATRRGPAPARRSAPRADRMRSRLRRSSCSTRSAAVRRVRSSPRTSAIGARGGRRGDRVDRGQQLVALTLERRLVGGERGESRLDEPQPRPPRRRARGGSGPHPPPATRRRPRRAVGHDRVPSPARARR